jgi:hypothetical protein
VRKHNTKLVASRRAVCAVALLLLGWTGALEAEPAEHLHFFRQNRDFVLRAFERLPRFETDPSDSARGWDFDPFAEWAVLERVQAVRAALDTASTPTDLGHFRATLGDLLDEAAAAAARLDDLDHRFAAHLRTACEVTLASAGNIDVQRIDAWLDGEHVATHATSPEERAALAAGGVLEVVRRVLEPRTQDLTMKVWIAGRPEPLDLAHAVEPVPDALVRLHVELSSGDEPRVVQTTLGGSP